MSPHASTFEQLAPSSLLLMGLRAYWLALAVAFAWLVLSLSLRRTKNGLTALSESWPIVILVWGLHLSHYTIRLFDNPLTSGPPRPPYIFFLQLCQTLLHSLLALILIIALLGLGQLITRGKAIAITTFPAVAALAAILGPLVDWLLVLLVATPIP